MGGAKSNLMFWLFATVCFATFFDAREAIDLSAQKHHAISQLQKAIDSDEPVAIAKAMLDTARAKLRPLLSPMQALRKGNVQEAWRRADRYDLERRALWYLLIAWHLQTIGKNGDAKETLKRLLSSPLPSFAPHPENPIPYILLAQVAKVDSKTFNALWRKLLEPEWQVDLVQHLLDAGNLDEALRIVRSLKRPKEMDEIGEVFDYALSDLAVALAKAGRFDEALQIARMVRLDWNNPTPEIAKAMAERGLIDRARKIGGHRILLHIAKIQSAKGKKDAAKKTFSQAIEIAKKRKDDLWLRELALAQAETIGIDDGVATARLIRSVQLRAETLITLAEKFTKKKQKEKAKALLFEALKTVKSIKPESWRIYPLQRLMYGFKAVGDLKQAIAVADEYKRLMEREVTNYWSQSICLEPYLATGRLDEAEKVARRIDEPINRLHALSEMAKAYALAKQIDRSKAIWDEVLRLAKGLPDRQRNKILEQVVDHQVEARQFQQAIETVKTYSPENEQPYLFAQIIRSQLQMNLPEEALKTLKQAIAMNCFRISFTTLPKSISLTEH